MLLYYIRVIQSGLIDTTAELLYMLYKTAETETFRKQVNGKKYLRQTASVRAEHCSMPVTTTIIAAADAAVTAVCNSGSIVVVVRLVSYWLNDIAAGL